MIKAFQYFKKLLIVNKVSIIYMCNAINKKSLTAVCFGMVCHVSLIHAQSRNEAKFAAIDVEKERPQIENRDSLYAKYLLEGDSVSIAGMYATDGTVGCKKGDEILSSVGSWIRNNIKNDSRHVTFTTITLQADGDLLVETGKAEGRSDMGELKYTFRYLVVWKKENGVWKLYRDVVL